jgi:hypothetical protein
MRKILVTAASLIVLVSPLRAQTTIGAASNTSVGAFTRGSSGFQSVGQSFTVPPINTTLSTFTLSVSSFFNGGALRFDAYVFAFDATNRRIAGSSLWSALNIAGSSNEFAFDARSFNTGNLSLTGGSTYMFLLTTSNQGSGVPLDASVLLGANDANGYAGGALWIASNGSSFSALQSTGAFSTVDGVTDAGFSALFVAGTVVPEPATLFLTAAGLLILAGARTRRRSAV